MSTYAELMAAGMSVGQAVQLGTVNTTGLVAAGTTKATALALTGAFGVFATVSASKGAVLPPASGAAAGALFNGGSNALSLYANGTDTINTNSAAAAFSVPNSKAVSLIPAATKWIAVLGA